MRRDKLVMLKPSVYKHAARAMKSGFRQTKTMGDPFQNGGVVVIRAGGEIAYSHVEGEAGDLADLDAVLAAL